MHSNGRNREIKDYIQNKKVPFWMVAEKLGITDSSFSRLLRYELSDEKREQIISITDELAKGDGWIDRSYFIGTTNRKDSEKG